MDERTLKFANTKGGRYLLGIQDGYPIVKLSPNSYHQVVDVVNNKPVIKGSFYSSNRVQRLLEPPMLKYDIANDYKKIETDEYKALLHFAELERNRYLPQIYLSSFTGSPQSGAGGGNVTTDGRVYFTNVEVHAVWATFHDASIGTAVDNGGDSYRMGMSASSNLFSSIGRYFFSLDLTTMGAGATIIGTPTWTFKITNMALTTIPSQSISLANSTFATANQLITDDYDQAGTTRYATDKTVASLGVGLHSFSFNSTGIAALESSAGGVIKMSSRLASDLDNSQPSWVAGAQIQIYFDHAENATPPVLTATYSPVGGAFLFGMI